MNVQKNKEQGFTIIEVVLVLAIAALIFLMVFIALPALQRSQRDTQRKNDLSRAMTALSNYQGNNRNALPTATTAGWNNFAASYLRAGGDTFEDPSQGNYTFQYTTARTTLTTLSNTIRVHASSTCQGESVVSAGSKKVAMSFKLEGGGIACVNN